ncbi:hypothetical protein F5144DRAFT_57689 [Chaetomium tenue]|uniref:Uncharacterized protein n=1 Tax=Chaetomium tenue TaxID=1854479 RepID=A0ACB7PQZ4_9PEZI|nr:hypothetical protein F5144DRAFT_57689 [Chaetomium globosum]
MEVRQRQLKIRGLLPSRSINSHRLCADLPIKKVRTVKKIRPTASFPSLHAFTLHLPALAALLLCLPRGLFGSHFPYSDRSQGWLGISLAANRGRPIRRHESRPSGCGCLMTPIIDNDSPETQNTILCSSCRAAVHRAAPRAPFQYPPTRKRTSPRKGKRCWAAWLDPQQGPKKGCHKTGSTGQTV